MSPSSRSSLRNLAETCVLFHCLLQTDEHESLVTVSLSCESVVDPITSDVTRNELVDDALSSEQLPLGNRLPSRDPIVNEFVTETGMCVTIVHHDSPRDNEANDVIERQVSARSSLSTDVLPTCSRPTTSMASRKCRKPMDSSRVRVSLRDSVRRSMASLVGRGLKQDLRVRRLSAIGRHRSAYVCFVCHKSMQTAWAIRRHLVEHHPDVIETTVSGAQNEEKMFSISLASRENGGSTRCLDCNGMTFDSYKAYQRHRKLHHYKQTCGLCQIILNGRLALRQHVTLHHPGVPVYKVNN